MRARRRENSGGLSENWAHFLNDEPYDATGILLFADAEEADVWAKWGAGVLERWIKERPGSRPSLWWKYQAPRLPAAGTGTFFDGKIPEPRQRVGGVGRTQWDAGANWVPFYRCGLPASRECWSFIIPNEPPQFEAQAVYLRRHGLLTPEEEEALKDRPEAFEPETINLATK